MIAAIVLKLSFEQSMLKWLIIFVKLNFIISGGVIKVEVLLNTVKNLIFYNNLTWASVLPTNESAWKDTQNDWTKQKSIDKKT